MTKAQSFGNALLKGSEDFFFSLAYGLQGFKACDFFGGMQPYAFDWIMINCYKYRGPAVFNSIYPGHICAPTWNRWFPEQLYRYALCVLGDGFCLDWPLHGNKVILFFCLRNLYKALTYGNPRCISYKNQALWTGDKPGKSGTWSGHGKGKSWWMTGLRLSDPSSLLMGWWYKTGEGFS